jgi:sugar lactone lactonase YvrE
MRRALALVVLAAALPATAHADRPRWDTRTLAVVPPPGFPARAYVAPNGRIYEGTYDNPSGDTVPSRVFEYLPDGTLLRSWTVAGQDLSQAHGVQVATSDAQGRLVLLDKAPARVLLLDPRTGVQTTYATFADLSTCGAPPCSPSLRDETPMADYGAWGPDGSLYVSDYQQAVIWRVPPGGGPAQVWLADKRLDGDMFGTAGLALAADHRTLVISQGSSAGLGAGNPATGRLYTVQIGADGRPGELAQLWESGPAEAPDGLAIAASGRIYVALVSPLANQLVAVGADGKEVDRSPAVFDAPSSVAFLGTSLIVAQQSYVNGDPSHMQILDVAVGEPGIPELIPGRSAKAKPKPKHRKRRKHRHRRRPHGGHAHRARAARRAQGA